MDYEKAYEEALERAKKEWSNNLDNAYKNYRERLEIIFPELLESEDERIRKSIIAIISNYVDDSNTFKPKMLAWLEKQGEPVDKGEISDGYHTFNELYYYRMLYNAAFFNMLPKEWVHKSKRHHDGEECFGGGWFIVMANLPTGQISNHYELKDWDLFQIPEREVADEWDGHTPQEAAERLHKYLLEKQGEQKPTWSEEDETSIAINNPEAYRIGFADGKAHAEEEMAIAWLEKQGQVKESSILQHEGTHEGVSCKENDNSLTQEQKSQRMISAEKTTEDEHWQEVRECAAITAMQGVMNFFGSIDYNKETIAELAVAQADALIEQLKKNELCLKKITSALK